MIIPETIRIMIIPDFGVSAEDEAMRALKSAIEAKEDFIVKVIDLPALVRAEHGPNLLSPSELFELSARKLEQLSDCKELLWDGSNNVEIAVFKTVISPKGLRFRYSITHSRSEMGAPHAIVVFGKSATLASGIGNCHVLFVNPQYDSEELWKKQHDLHSTLHLDSDTAPSLLATQIATIL